MEDITLEQVINGEIKPEDVRISRETLEMQAQIAESMNRDAVARNFRRASELSQGRRGRGRGLGADEQSANGHHGQNDPGHTAIVTSTVRHWATSSSLLSMVPGG